MFGMGLFEGADVNAGELGAAGGEGGGGYYAPAPGSYNEAGQMMGGVNEAGQPMSSVDPASQAAGAAYQNAAGINQQTNAAIGMAGGIAHGAGLFTAIDNMIGKGRKVAKNQRIYSRHQAQFAINQAHRAIDQYRADSAVQGEKLQASYMGRGLGSSSIMNDGMQYYHDTVARQAAQLDENLTMAELGQKLVKSQISQSYVQPYIGFWNAIGAMV